jgi:uncharacterized phage protein (TIGR02218 family)
MKPLRQEVKDDVNSGASTLVRCVRITRRDGEVFRFTEHDQPLPMDSYWDGSQTVSQDTVTYEPTPALLPDTAFSWGSDGQAASVDLEGALEPGTINREDFAAGIWDFADVRVFRTIWVDPVEDDVPDLSGKTGEATIGEPGLTIGMQSLARALETDIGTNTSVTCRAQFGDSDCKVRIDPPVWPANTSVAVREDGDAGTGDVVKPSTENGRFFKCVTAGTTGSSEPSWDTTVGNITSDGTAEWEAVIAHQQTDTVQSVTSSSEFTGNLGFPDDWFGAGTVRFTSGDNAGIEKEVETYVSDTYTLWVAMPFPVEVGDTFVASAGCRKRKDQDCIDKHDNVLNMRAEVHAAGPGTYSKFGGQQ